MTGASGPKPMVICGEEHVLDNDAAFGLHGWDYSVVVEEPGDVFNCIAWAAGDTENWWWPTQGLSFAYWPPGVPRATTVAAFVHAFSTIGYESSPDDSWEEGHDKIALYVKQDGDVAHAARQLDELCWSSKLGAELILCHPLKALEGSFYGEARVFLRRPIDPAIPDPVRQMGCPGGR